MNEDVKLCECIATEDEWLDISYTQMNYIQDEQDSLTFIRTTAKKRRKEQFNKVKKIALRAFICLFVLGTLLAMRFVEDGFIGEVLVMAKSAYSQNIVDVIADGKNRESIIDLPINVMVDGVENGTVRVIGGKVLLNFKKGIVEDVTEDTVTVSVDENLKIIYSGLSKVLVNVGDEVLNQAVLGKYVTSVNVNLLYAGEVVKDIATVNYSLVWKI